MSNRGVDIFGVDHFSSASVFVRRYQYNLNVPAKTRTLHAVLSAESLKSSCATFVPVVHISYAFILVCYAKSVLL